MLHNMKVHHRILVQALSKLAIISCIIPSYDFKTKRLTHRLSFKIYSIFFTATVMSLSYVTFVCRKNELFPSYNIRYVVNSIVETTEIVMFVVTTLGASFWNMETWERLVGQSSRLERDISTRTSFKFQPSVFLIAGTAYDAILTVYHLYRLRWDFFRYYSVLMFLHYTRIICMYLICYMVRLVEHSYRNMNEILVHISLCSLIKGDTLEKLKKVEEMYMKTDRIINIFNRYFGWILLLTFSQVIGRLLLCLAIFIQIRPNILFCSIAEMWEAIILNISYTGMTVVSYFFAHIDSNKFLGIYAAFRPP